MRPGARICIIPARGGSKRIPRKNVRLFEGRPILSYPIQAAIKSGAFDEIMVSTDDEEIADVARDHGAQVPFLRSPETSGDFAGTLEVVSEVLATYRTLMGREFELGCCLFATAALVTPERLQEGLRLITASPDLAYVLSLIPYGAPIHRAVYIQDQRVHMFYPEHYSSRSQDLPKAYKDAGQWHWFRAARIHEMKPVLGPTSGAVLLSEMEAQDIDDEDDWRLAEAKYLIRNGIR